MKHTILQELWAAVANGVLNIYIITLYNCRAASVSERSEANDRVLFELPLYLQYIQCKLQNTIVM